MLGQIYRMIQYIDNYYGPLTEMYPEFKKSTRWSSSPVAHCKQEGPPEEIHEIMADWSWRTRIDKGGEITHDTRIEIPHFPAL
jgi:hypothetical protein